MQCFIRYKDTASDLWILINNWHNKWWVQLFQLDCWICFQKNFHWPFCHCKSIKFLSSVTFRLPKSSGTRRFVEEKFKTCDLIFLHTNLYLKCFSQMQISNIHKSMIVMKSIDTLFQECFWSRSKKSQHVFYRVQNHLALPSGFKPDKTLLLGF